MSHIRKNTIYIYAFWGALFFERSIWINYLQHQRFTTIQIGLLQTLLTLAMFVCELPSGVLTDRLGPKRTMNLGHVLIIVYLLSMLLAVNYASLIVGFLAYGVGLSLISGSDQTLLYQFHPEENYQHKIGIFEAITIIGLALSSLLGGYLTTIAWSAIFVIGIVTQLGSMILLGLIKVSPSSADQPVNETQSIKQLLATLLATLKMRHIRYLVLTAALFEGSISVLINFAQLLFSAKHFSAYAAAVILTVATGFSAVASVMLEKISLKIGTKRSIITFFIVTMLMFLPLFSGAFTWVIVGFLMMQFSFEFVDVALNAVIQDLANDRIRTSLISSVNTLTAGLMFVETMLVSGLFSKFGVTNAFIVFGVVTTLLALLLYGGFLRTSKSA
ncbi:MFS transporter [Lactiplantibacillus modestisalitolerans]|uniref:MFS transporter n=1 Tax=Lactiplantibacillus modestisalitolerans TaxID=1457219 RepID=A0ABV5WV37_9LACO|nr:MFS transporter [Lactiplantibacillus modestisalitolerans]